MIPERHMKQARRVDNGEMVRGDLINLHDGRKYIIDNRFGACIDNVGNFINTEAPFVNQVDPATVEDVPVKPKRETTLVGDYRCPNCNAAFIDGMGTTPYCGNCGQRLLWEE